MPEREAASAKWLWIILRMLMVPPVLGLTFFLPAGSLDWQRGWRFLAVCGVGFGASAIYLWWVNPEIFVARSRIQKGTKCWDRILIVGFLFPTFMAVPVVAALDDGRFGWSQLSWGPVALGYVLFLSSVALTTWAQGVNRFFEPGVRIQTERGHHVVQTGPYALVRHPGYLAACVMFVGKSLSLGSLWALIPAGLSAGLIVLRTVWEDRTLHDELPGYKEYSQRVRFRMLPGLW